MNKQEQNHGTQVKVVGKRRRTKFTLYPNVCVKCGKSFVSRNSRAKFCSHHCYSQNKIGKGHLWGDKISAKLKGVPKSPEHVRNAHEAWLKVEKKWRVGDKNPNWKGENVGYDALHDWVGRYRGYPKECERCGTKEKRVYHWANKTGKYMRDLDDWVRLCVPCHSRLDKSRPFSYKRRRA